MGEVAARDHELRLRLLDEAAERVDRLRSVVAAEVEVGDVQDTCRHGEGYTVRPWATPVGARARGATPGDLRRPLPRAAGRRRTAQAAPRRAADDRGAGGALGRWNRLSMARKAIAVGATPSAARSASASPSAASSSAAGARLDGHRPGGSRRAEPGSAALARLTTRLSRSGPPALSPPAAHRPRAGGRVGWPAAGSGAGRNSAPPPSRRRTSASPSRLPWRRDHGRVPPRPGRCRGRSRRSASR